MSLYDLAEGGSGVGFSGVAVWWHFERLRTEGEGGGNCGGEGGGSRWWEGKRVNKGQSAFGGNVAEDASLAASWIRDGMGESID